MKTKLFSLLAAAIFTAAASQASTEIVIDQAMNMLDAQGALKGLSPEQVSNVEAGIALDASMLNLDNAANLLSLSDAKNKAKELATRAYAKLKGLGSKIKATAKKYGPKLRSAVAKLSGPTKLIGQAACKFISDEQSAEMCDAVILATAKLMKKKKVAKADDLSEEDLKTIADDAAVISDKDIKDAEAGALS